MNLIKRLALIAALAVLAGCAHDITVSPDIAKIDRPRSAERIDAPVAYYIPAELMMQKVTTPGGGGDKVSYTPYKDIETAFYKMLTNVFKSVTKAKGTTGADTDGARFVIAPKIHTNSSSPSPFTWPPTRFTTEITSVITDASGKQVTTISVAAEGAAEFDEFKRNFSLSAQRSTEAVLLKLQDALLAAPELRQ